MKTKWDYTDLAQSYLKRPNYSPTAIDELVSLSGLSSGAKVCDVGAGVAHLTLELLKRGFQVTAVEPNDAMRALGRQRAPEVDWVEATAEETGLEASAYAMVTFGSSFNVTDRQRALKEVERLLVPGGWFACMWNHRDLEDPIQAKIEALIKEAVPDYSYGTRREDQTPLLEASGLFQKVHFVEGQIMHTQQIEDVVEAWRSHATLARQAGDRFGGLVDKIQQLLEQLGTPSIEVPYTTRLWCGQLRGDQD